MRQRRTLGKLRIPHHLPCCPEGVGQNKWHSRRYQLRPGFCCAQVTESARLISDLAALHAIRHPSAEMTSSCIAREYVPWIWERRLARETGFCDRCPPSDRVGSPTIEGLLWLPTLHHQHPQPSLPSSRLPITACFFRKSLHSFLFKPKASMLWVNVLEEKHPWPLPS